MAKRKIVDETQTVEEVQPVTGEEIAKVGEAHEEVQEVEDVVSTLAPKIEEIEDTKTESPSQAVGELVPVVGPFMIDDVPLSELVAQNPLQVFEFLPEELICDSSKNGRSGFVKADRTDLKKAIKSEGRVLQPVLFKIDANGQPYLTVGYGRYEVVKSLNEGIDAAELMYLPAIYDTKESSEGESDQDTFLTNLRENLGRKDLTPIDKLHIIMKMKKSKDEGGLGMKQSAIAKETNWTEAYVSYLVNLAKVTNKKHIEAIHKGIIGYKEAVEYTYIKDPEKMAAAFDAAIEKYDLADEKEGGKKGKRNAQEAIAEAQAERGVSSVRNTKQARAGLAEAIEMASLNVRVQNILSLFDAYLTGSIKTNKNLIAKLETATTAKVSELKAVKAKAA